MGSSILQLLKHDQAIIIYVKHKQKLCAGILLAHDQECAYMLYNWQDNDSPRGTISSLIFEAVNWTFKIKKLKKYDFEGSVFYDIDYFFSGFNGNIVPYGYIHWSSSKQTLFDLIDKSLNISGRLCNLAQ